jgi:hypothetical protein
LLQSILIALFACVFSISASADESSPQIYLYKVHVKNANEMLNGYFESDMVTSKASAAIKQNQPEAFIDLHLRFRETDDRNLVDGTVEVLMNSKMNDTVFAALKSKICEDDSGSCKVDIKEEVYDVNELSLVTELEPLITRPTPPKTQHLLEGKGMLPKFSEGCDTGKYEDSFNNSASTPEAKKYISDAGVYPKTTWEMSLNKKDGTELFRFGHLKKSK